MVFCMVWCELRPSPYPSPTTAQAKTAKIFFTVKLTFALLPLNRPALSAV